MRPLVCACELHTLVQANARSGHFTRHDASACCSFRENAGSCALASVTEIMVQSTVNPAVALRPLRIGFLLIVTCPLFNGLSSRSVPRFVDVGSLQVTQPFRAETTFLSNGGVMSRLGVLK